MSYINKKEIQYLLSLSNTITREGAIHLLKTMNNGKR